MKSIPNKSLIVKLRITYKILFKSLISKIYLGPVFMCIQASSVKVKLILKNKINPTTNLI